MATVATLLALTPLISNFDVPNTDKGGRDPFAVCEFVGSVIVPAKADVDETTLTVTLAFPNNYVFKIATINIHFTSAQATDGIADLVEETASGIIGQGFQGLNQNLAITVSTLGLAIDSRALTGQDNLQPMVPIGDYQIPIRTGVFPGDNSMSWAWADNTVDATVAVTIFFRLRALMYTIEQFNSYPMFDAVPVIGV